jgi:hypothetical protein
MLQIKKKGPKVFFQVNSKRCPVFWFLVKFMLQINFIVHMYRFEGGRLGQIALISLSKQLSFSSYLSLVTSYQLIVIIY